MFIDLRRKISPLYNIIIFIYRCIYIYNIKYVLYKLDY